MSTPDASPRPDWDGLFARRTLGVRLGLAVVRGAFEALGRPAGDVPAVHVVGTNGKGSTASMIAHGAAQRAARHHEHPRIGLYTSPHLQRVSERVVLDGRPTDEAELWAAVQAVDAAERRAPGERPLSFFEVLTLAAMVVFDRASAELLVVEAGLGGRLDATRVVAAAVVAVTSIAADHQQWLGDTLAAIAGEKAGVFVPGVPVFSAPQPAEVAAVLTAQAHRIGCPLHFVTPLARAPIGLPGEHQRINAALALATLQARWPDATAADLDGVRWPGRLQTVPRGAGRVTLDVAHNPAGCEAVAAALAGPDGDPPDMIVVGCQPDKDRAGMERALAALGVPQTWLALDDPALARTAWTHVQSGTDRGEHVLVCGSHLLVAAVAQSLRAGPDHHHPPPDPSDPRRP